MAPLPGGGGAVDVAAGDSLPRAVQVQVKEALHVVGRRLGVRGQT